MTSALVIENLQKMHLVGTSDRRSHQEAVKNHNQALDYAIEKMTPKKPLKMGIGKNCPDCKKFVFKWQNFCESCGQALDWRD